MGPCLWRRRCVLAWVLIDKTTWGFAARIAGGNMRAAQVQGLPVGRLIIGFTALGGALAGLAGFFEVAAVHGSANASLASGYGYTGILIAFLARHNPLAIIPVAILLAGFEASSGLDPTPDGFTRRHGACPARLCLCVHFDERYALWPVQDFYPRTLEDCRWKMIWAFG